MQRTMLRKLNLFLISFFGFALLAYLVMNGGAFWRIVRYDILLHTPLASADLRNGDILEVVTSAAGSVAGDWTLVIPKIEVAAPIVVPDGSTKSAILASLESGVGLYPGSVEPGTTGRTILLAHSSRASWYRGGYATVFALLPKLEQFDEFTIVGGGKKYTYQVFATKVMTPDEANRFTATTPDDAEVDLVTCYPIGSASKRIVVQAKLIAEEGI